MLRSLRTVLARHLGVPDGAGAGAWAWRLFVRPAPSNPNRVDRALDDAAAWFARQFGVQHRGSPREWLLRLFVPPPAPAATGFGAAWRRQWRALRVAAARALWWLAAQLPTLDRARWSARFEAAADTAWLHSGVPRTAALFVCGIGFWLTVTTPLGWSGQLVFSLVLWTLALFVRKLPGHVPTLMLITLSMVATCRYGWWRITQSMGVQPGWELALAYGLLAAEIYVWVVMVLGFAQTVWRLQRRPVPLPPAPQHWPSVDIFIPTYNEPLSVLKPTVLATQVIDWPADRLRVYILDDGKREEMRAFAAAVGVGYITRDNNSHAKAGNLNHALGHTQGEFIAIFDCDHLPVRSFLQTTMGWMLRDERCAMIQTPHHFFSPDPFERNLDTFRRVPNEGALFYGLIQDGNDFWNATFFCGSCAVLRRGPLLEVGGIAVETVTEDAHTALKMHRRGYNTAYLNITQAAGLATESLSGHIGQRIRWARGMAQIFRTDNPLLGKGLSLMQRLCYSNAMMHFFYGIPRVVFLTAPLSYLYFELHIIGAAASVIALYVLPHVVLPHITNAHMQGAHRHSFWAEVYETVLAWYITLPTTVAFINPRLGKFNVTAKGGLVKDTHFDWQISRPYIVLAALNGLGLALGLVRLVWWNSHEAGTVALNLIWTVFNLLMLGAAIGVARERRQVRVAHRVAARVPACLLLPRGRTHRCHTVDYSMNGLGLELGEALPLEAGTRLQVMMESGSGEHVFPAQVVGRRGVQLGLQFDALTLEQEQALIQCTFARADAWTGWDHRFDRDKPMQGLKEIFTLGIEGYRSLFDSFAKGARRRYASAKQRLRARAAAL